jgi:hypothetical protein
MHIKARDDLAKCKRVVKFGDLEARSLRCTVYLGT